MSNQFIPPTVEPKQDYSPFLTDRQHSQLCEFQDDISLGDESALWIATDWLFDVVKSDLGRVAFGLLPAVLLGYAGRPFKFSMGFSRKVLVDWLRRVQPERKVTFGCAPGGSPWICHELIQILQEDEHLRQRLIRQDPEYQEFISIHSIYPGVANFVLPGVGCRVQEAVLRDLKRRILYLFPDILCGRKLTVSIDFIEDHCMDLLRYVLPGTGKGPQGWQRIPWGMPGKIMNRRLLQLGFMPYFTLFARRFSSKSQVLFSQEVAAKDLIASDSQLQQLTQDIT